MLDAKSIAIINKLLEQKKDVKVTRGPGGAPVIYSLVKHKQYAQPQVQGCKG